MVYNFPFKQAKPGNFQGNQPSNRPRGNNRLKSAFNRLPTHLRHLQLSVCKLVRKEVFIAAQGKKLLSSSRCAFSVCVCRNEICVCRNGICVCRNGSVFVGTEVQIIKCVSLFIKML
jgi:hypothetical protein